jgi:hypothetical protein
MTFHQSNASQLWQRSEFSDRGIGESDAATEVDIPDSCTVLHERLDGIIRDMAAVSKMNVVQILTELADGVDSYVSNISAFCQNQISKARSHADDFLDGTICKSGTAGKIQDAEMLEYLTRR